MNQMINEIHELEPAPGFSKVMVPGEPEQIKEQAQLQGGVAITESVYRYLNRK